MIIANAFVVAVIRAVAVAVGVSDYACFQGENCKFIAFKGPTNNREPIAPGVYTFTTGDYLDTFKDKGVSAVVRLNEPSTYDAQVPP